MTNLEYAYIALGALVLLLALVVFYVWRKGRPLAQADVFRASRWTRGNHLFPTQVLITPGVVVQLSPQWIGKHEESIHIAHVASVRIDTNLLFSNVFIETSGGQSPVSCHGHYKSDAEQMKRLIERYQTEYFKAPGGAPRA